MAYSCLQAYYRAAKACLGQGNRKKACEYLEEGIEICVDSNTEDLRTYLDQMMDEDNFSCMYSNSSSD